jgi:hypothetical protein|tara:strand:- start:151 stop:537 length:387 start_codon:yes stop_codon:yes gene_type:complete
MKTVKYLVNLCGLTLGMGCTTVATKTIEATATVTKTTLTAGGKVGKVAIETTADLAASAFKKSAITVIDTGTGISHKVPWKDGLSAYAVSQTSKAAVAEKTIEVVRGVNHFRATAQTVLKPGDVVRIK